MSTFTIPDLEQRVRKAKDELECIIANSHAFGQTAIDHAIQSVEDAEREYDAACASVNREIARMNNVGQRTTSESDNDRQDRNENPR